MKCLRRYLSMLLILAGAAFILQSCADEINGCIASADTATLSISANSTGVAFSPAGSCVTCGDDTGLPVACPGGVNDVFLVKYTVLVENSAGSPLSDVSVEISASHDSKILSSSELLQIISDAAQPFFPNPLLPSAVCGDVSSSAATISGGIFNIESPINICTNDSGTARFFVMYAVNIPYVSTITARSGAIISQIEFTTECTGTTAGPGPGVPGNCPP